MEIAKFDAFMSGIFSLYLVSVGLLGEYCPTSRKKSWKSVFGCMHLEPHQNFKQRGGYQWVQPFFERGHSGFEVRKDIQRSELLCLCIL